MAHNPTVVGTPTETAISTAGTSHVVNLPSGTTGNLLLAIMSKGSAGTTPSVNALTGWNELLDEAIVLGLYAAWRVADGTEGATTTFTLSSATRGAWIVYEIAGAYDPTVQPPQVGTTATGSGTTPNPPSVSVTGGSKDILTIACFGRDGEEADDDTWVTAAPSGFGSLLQKACGTAGSSLAGMIATAHLAQTTATADPATFTCATGAWRAQTIVVHPVPPTQTAVAEVSLGAGSEPFTRTGHSLKVRARTTAGAGTLRAALYEGATNRSGDLESSALTTSLADYTLAIPDASAANITDYSNLSIRFWGYADAGGSIVFEVDQLYLETPKAFIVKTGFGKAGADGHGASQKVGGANTYTKSGFASAGLVGSGASASLTQETGFGTVGTVGSGGSASATQRTGAGIVGLVGSGPTASVNQETGFGTIGGVASGPRSRDRVRTGFGTVGLTASGADAATSVETGFGKVGAVGSGASVFISGSGATYTKAGFGSAGLVGSGVSASITQESGAGVVGLVGAGVRARDRARAGVGVVGLVGSGADAFSDVNAGFGKVGAAASGASQKESVVGKSGFGTVGLVGSGASASVEVGQGAGVVGVVGSGADAMVDVESGFAKVGAAGSGIGTKAGLQVKAGAGVAGLVGAGRDVMVDAETGAGVAGTVGSGASAGVFVERGFGTVGTVGSGARDSAAVKIKSGYATVGTVGSGGKIREHSRTGYGVAGTIATGTKMRVITRTGYADLTLVGAGRRNTALGKTGYATVGADGYGISEHFVFFTLLDELWTGHIGNGRTGGIDGRENGHIGDTVGGVIDEDHEEDLVLV